MATERKSFFNLNGNQLSANLDLPDDRPPVAYALYAHCFTCSKNLKSIVRISRALTRFGIAVLRFDFTGIAESEGEFSATTLSHNVQDILAAAAFLQQTLSAPQLLIGHSLGGSAMQLAAPQLDAARALVLIATPQDPAHLGDLLAGARQQALQQGESLVTIGGNQFRLTRDFFQDLLGHTPVISNSPRPLLILHSPEDQTVPIEHAFQLFAQAQQPKSLISLPGADHILSNENDAAWVGELIGVWAGRHLGGQ